MRQRQYLENVTKLLLMTNRKLHMGFRLAPKSKTLNNLELDGGRLPTAIVFKYLS